ncbi:alpha-(1-_6)-mannopyranosyltransferase A [Corynebacterium sp. 13CS0277]|uniref:alpha-(1->6)-mannopyranosyltransferase A n=1 Tax=Corynebacterium sp. 13CS0277 TaxID=2071994 RepID=UPI000D0238B5|nr:alpha-(1->6)-mannopyranosyltransferase A [Corynebacterium sp. 13CS0277]PRQ11141.1 alpha-(1->6)-mannopyranosyltransferase A [Corynebacterium sp. 13CS0277]
MTAPASHSPTTPTSPTSLRQDGPVVWLLRALRRHPLADTARLLGTAGTALIAAGSFGAGAVRYSGGMLRHLGLGNLTFGHAAVLLNACFWTGLTALVVAWVCLGRAAVFTASGEQQRPFAPAAAVVRRCLVWWTVPLVFAAPVLSRDVYSYLMQGALTRDGFDAYTQGAIVDPGVYLAEVSHDWRTTTTPYGPLHLWIGQVITSITGDNVTLGVVCYKALSVLGFVLIALTTSRIATRLGGNPALALWLGVANPVTLTHLIGGMHNEALMVGLSGVAVALAVRGRMLSATAVLAAAIAVKATAILILPFVAWMAAGQLLGWWGRRRSRTVVGSPTTPPDPTFTSRLLAAVLCGAGLGAWLVAVLAVLTAAVGSTWGWVSEISGNGKVINPLAFPSFLAGLIVSVGRQFSEDFSYNDTLAVTRAVATVAMLAGLVASWLWFHRSRRQAIGGMVAAFCVACVFNAVTLPWYYISPLALVGTIRPPRWVTSVVIVGSITVGMSFTASGNHKLYDTIWIWPLLLIAWATARWLVGRPLWARQDR